MSELLIERLAQIDCFNYAEIASGLAGTICRMKPPFVFAICGRWGTGKSTFLKFLSENISLTDPHGIVLYFNAWRASIHHNLLGSFVFELTEQLGKVARGASWKDKRKFLQALEILLDSTVEALGPLYSPIGTQIYRRVRQQQLESLKRVLQSEARLLEDFNRVAAHIADKGRTAYVFIDEIDRCSPQQVVLTLEALRIVFCGPDEMASLTASLREGRAAENAIINVAKTNRSAIPFKYIITMDEHYVTRAFEECHGLEINEAHLYTAKFIQYRYHFPVYNWKRLVRTTFDACEENKPWLPKRSVADFVSLLDALDVASVREARLILVYVLIWQQQFFGDRPGSLTIMRGIRETFEHDEEMQAALLRLLNAYLMLQAGFKTMYPHAVPNFLQTRLLLRLAKLTAVSPLCTPATELSSLARKEADDGNAGDERMREHKRADVRESRNSGGENVHQSLRSLRALELEDVEPVARSRILDALAAIDKILDEITKSQLPDSKINVNALRENLVHYLQEITEER